jgi:hypothetical protein
MTEIEEVKAELSSMKQVIEELNQEIKILKKLRRQDYKQSQIQLRRTLPKTDQSFNRG